MSEIGRVAARAAIFFGVLGALTIGANRQETEAGLAFRAQAESAAHLDSLRAPARGLILWGDTQSTTWVESRLLGRERNEVERQRLIEEIVRSNPDGALILGDLVTVGSRLKDWQIFDQLSAPFRAASIPLLAALGNHDYMGANSLALRHARARFPQLESSRWYTRRYGSIALVVLDSNLAELGEPEWISQRAWYEQELRALEADPSVSAILCVSHHPPFTNSSVTDDEVHVQQAFLPAFFGAHKTRAWISGHAHAYEHFEKQGRKFLVSGGGGGPRVKLLGGDKLRHADQYAGSSPRPFHFLHLMLTGEQLTIEVRGFSQMDEPLRTLETLRL